MNDYSISGSEYDAKTIRDQQSEIKYLNEEVSKLEMQVSLLKSELSSERKSKKVLNQLASSMKILTE